MGCEIYFEVGPHSRGNGLAAAMPLRSIFPFEMMRCTAARRHERLLAPCCCAPNLCYERARCRSLLIAAAMARWRRISRGRFYFHRIFCFNPAPLLRHRGSKAHAQANSCRQGSRRRAHREAAMSDGGKMAPTDIRGRRAPPPGHRTQEFRAPTTLQYHRRMWSTLPRRAAAKPM